MTKTRERVAGIGIEVAGHRLVGMEMHPKRPIEGQIVPKDDQLVLGVLYFAPESTAPSGLPHLIVSEGAPLVPIHAPRIGTSPVTGGSEVEVPVEGKFARGVRNYWDKFNHLQGTTPQTNSENGK